MAALVFDKIGKWSEIKLEILEKYGSAYTTVFPKHSRLRKFYVDAFSGAGYHRSKGTGKQIDGSPARALRIKPPFDRFYFIDWDESKTDHLSQLCEEYSNVQIFTGDASKNLMEEVFPNIHYDLYTRALCLLDPYGLHLEWRVIEYAGKSGAIDMVLNFPVMDMNRNAMWHDPSGVDPNDIQRMNLFWGDETWRRAAYVPSRQGELFSDPVPEKQSNSVIVEAFCDRLKKVACFDFVAEPLPMKNSNNAVLYYLVFASCNYTGNEMITDIFSKYR